MTTKEQRELDAFCAEHVMGYIVKRNAHGNLVAIDHDAFHMTIEHVYGVVGVMFNPTTDPAASREVEKKCIEKLGKDCKDMVITNCPDYSGYFGGDWSIVAQFRECHKPETASRVFGETLEIAIALFAKKLFFK